MGDPKIQKQKIIQQLMGGYEGPSKYGIWGNYGSGGGGGGWGDYGGGYGGGGDGGIGGFGYNEYAQQGVAQPPGVGPGTLQEQVNQGFLSGMGTRFSRGGIVSLLRLGE